MNEPVIRIWLDDDARTGPPAWEGMMLDLPVIPAKDDTIELPGEHPQPGGVAVIDHRHFAFGGPSRVSSGPRFWLESIELTARSE